MTLPFRKRCTFATLAWLARALFLSALALAPEVAAAQEPNQPKNDGGTIVVEKYGTEGFRYLLDQHGFKPLRRPSEALEDPVHTAIILLGMDSLEFLDEYNFVDAVERGAAILVASDRPHVDTRLLGVRIANGFVVAKPDDCYRGLAHYPFVMPLAKGNALARSLFKDIDSSGENALATNYASCLNLLRSSPMKLDPLASYPPSAKCQNQTLAPNRDFFAVGGPHGDGRVLVLADHSVFVNVMILRTDNANADFTHNCIEWLQGQGPEKKTRCLFVEDGNIQTEFRLPSMPRNDNWLEWALKAALMAEKHGDQIAGELEERDFFNQLTLSQWGPRVIGRAALILITLLLLAVGFIRFARGRTAADPARTLVTPEVAYLIPHGNVLQQRFQGQLDGDNVYEPARSLVRDFLGGLDAEPDEHGLPPRLDIEPGYPNEAALRQRIMRLWDIAFGDTPVRIKPEEWRPLTQELKDVLKDADNGWWRFTPVRKT